ncbi:MAG: hypothetical protein HXS47_07635 [Theionarchaea archaeon]|nr:hypothetical protein [Theionarchaea archaeon]
MDSINVKVLLEALKKGDTKKASEIVEKIPDSNDFEKGYKKALRGLLAAVENKEPNSFFMKMLSDQLTKKTMDSQRMESKKKSSESFRPPMERGYERAWYDVLSIFLGKKKVGLEKHIEGELY